MKTFVVVIGWYFAARLGLCLVMIATARTYPRTTTTTALTDTLAAVEYTILCAWAFAVL